MWGLGIVVGLIGIGFTIWEIATRPDTVAPGLKPAGLPPSSARAQIPLPPQPDPASAGLKALDNWYKMKALQAWLAKSPSDRAAACGWQSGDAQAADVWSAAYLGWNLSLEPRLELMINMVPFVQWPAAAKRVWCFYKGP